MVYLGLSLSSSYSYIIFLWVLFFLFCLVPFRYNQQSWRNCTSIEDEGTKRIREREEKEKILDCCAGSLDAIDGWTSTPRCKTSAERDSPIDIHTSVLLFLYRYTVYFSFFLFFCPPLFSLISSFALCRCRRFSLTDCWFLPYLQHAPASSLYFPFSSFFSLFSNIRPTRWFVQPFVLWPHIKRHDEIWWMFLRPDEEKKQRILRTIAGGQHKTLGTRVSIVVWDCLRRRRRVYMYGLSHHFPFNLHSYHVAIYFAWAFISTNKYTQCAWKKNKN